MTLPLMPSPPTDTSLERLWERFQAANARAHEPDATLEEKAKAEMEFWAFIFACVDKEGEV